MNTTFGRSSLVNEKFIELCDEFINKSFFEKRPHLEEIKKEWIYFKILLNNKMLDKQQISEYILKLKDKLLFQKSANINLNYTLDTPIVNRPAAISCSDPIRRKPQDISEFSTHKPFLENNSGFNIHNPFLKTTNYSNEIYEFMQKNNEEINKIVYVSKIPYRISEEIDLIDEITQKYH